jgi:hypothetical protein
MQNIGTLFDNMANAATGIGVSVAIFFVIWGAYLIMSAGSSVHQAESGKAAITRAIIGLVIVVAARVLVQAIKGYIPAA